MSRRGLTSLTIAVILIIIACLVVASITFLAMPNCISAQRVEDHLRASTGSQDVSNVRIASEYPLCTFKAVIEADIDGHHRSGYCEANPLTGQMACFISE